MLAALFLLLATFAAQASNPYVLVLVAEPATQQKALELRREFMRFDPFSRMGDQLAVKVQVTSPGVMVCEPDLDGADRIHCNHSELLELMKKPPFNADAVVLIPNRIFRSSASPRSYSEPYATLDPTESVLALVHEFMHLLNFADEYTYSLDVKEVADNCKWQRYGTLNAAVFTPYDHYTSSDAAKIVHSTNIPWSRWIEPSVPVTVGTKLGLWHYHGGDDYPNSPSLYRVEACEKQTVWRPFPNTIMRDPHRIKATKGIMPALYKILIAQAMSRVRGAPIRLDPPVDYECLRKIDRKTIREIPALARFKEPLRERLERFYKRSPVELSYDALKLFPEILGSISELRQTNPACFAAMNLKIAQVDPNSPLPLEAGIRGYRLYAFKTFLEGLVLVAMSGHSNVCSIDDTLKMKIAADRLRAKVEGFSARNAMLLVAEDRILDEGEGDWDNLAKELMEDPQTSEDSRLAREMLGAKLYDDYRVALRKYHYASPQFDCRARAREMGI